MNSLSSLVSSLTNSTMRISKSCVRTLCSSSGNESIPKGPVRQFKAPTVYKPKQLPWRYGYNLSPAAPHKQNFYDEGPLPKINKPISFEALKEYKARPAWSKYSAIYGQNDYIDILGDGSVQPWQLMEGPSWIKGDQLNEFQRVLRRLQQHGDQLYEERPKKYRDLAKRLRYLYKRHNRCRPNVPPPRWL